jgi:hypothetical protein
MADSQGVGGALVEGDLKKEAVIQDVVTDTAGVKIVN